ncbi:MAG: hypothetical protein ACOX0Q_02680, partial [Syntrophomonadaceae bacterium]
MEQSYTPDLMMPMRKQPILSPQDNSITLGKLYNEDLGELTINASSAGAVKGSITIFNNDYLPNIVINNWSTFDLILGQIAAVNGQLGAPVLNIGGQVSYVFDTEIPSLTIVSHNDTDLHFSKSVDVGDGNLDIIMNGGDVNTAANEGQGKPAAVWANRLTITGAGNIGQVSNRFNAYILDIPEIPGTSGVIETIKARPTYIALQALGDIYAAFTHVVVNLENEQRTANPILTLDKIQAGGVADLLVNAPHELVYQGNANLDQAIDVSQPGRRDTLVRLAGSESELTIDAGNGKTYTLMPNGMIKINQGITIRGSHYYVGDSEISSDSGNTQIAHYYLPSGDIVAVDRQSGRIVNVIAFDGRSYDLDAITFISAEGKQTIQFKLEKFNVIYSYDSNEVLKEVFIEINQEHLINGGVTIYVDIEPSQMSELGWTLPDGTRVYYKNAFLQDGDEVRPIFLGMNGDNYLYLLEPLSQDRPFYHVVEFEVDGDNYTFINGYT